MWRVVAGHLLHRGGRAAAMLAAVLVATTSFVVLTGTAETERLRVRGTVERGPRAPYDVLVRPRGTRIALERSDALVRPGALSGIAGGITPRQWRTVLRQPGVAVAAPIATIGYALPERAVAVDLTRQLGGARSALFRVDLERSTDRGLTRRRDVPLFAYVTRRRLLPEPHVSSLTTVRAARVVVGGQPRPICDDGYAQLAPQGPFDHAARGGERGNVDCSSTVSGRWGERFAPFARRHVGVVVRAPLPYVIAAIDPEQEAKLTGLPAAVVGGRMLRASDRPSDDFVPRVPVLAADRPYADEATRAVVRRLSAGAARRFERARGVAATEAALPAGGGRVVLRRDIVPTAFSGGGDAFGSAVTTYWAVGPTAYDRAEDGVLTPRPAHNGAAAWATAGGGFVAAPLSADDVQFRRIAPRVGAAEAQIGQVFPALTAVGRFDPRRLRDTGALAVALGTAPALGLAGADGHSRALLRGRALQPNGNIAGYQTQAPLLLTTLRSLPAFAGANFTPNAGRAPISAIRVRVAGAHGVDAVSRERVRRAAEAIQAATGLQTDFVAGSSPAPQTIALPAGRHGRPALRLTELWVRKGVATAILAAVDRKSVVLFVLILLVCALFVANAVGASVRARRRELGVLSCVGWDARRLLGVVALEVAALGALAGVLGGLAAIPLAATLDVRFSLLRAALAVPAALLLALAAGAIPALRAARAEPVDAVRPAARRPRTARSPRGVASLAVANLARVPGRTALAAASLAIGVCALTVLLAATIAFRDALVGSLLGDAVAVDVRTSDYVAVVIAVLLGGAAVADVLYIGIRERGAELATLVATGWDDAHVARLVCVEGAGIGLLGSLAGAALGLAATAAFAGALTGDLVLTSLAAVAAGTLVASVASLVPALGLRRIATPRLLAGD